MRNNQKLVMLSKLESMRESVARIDLPEFSEELTYRLVKLESALDAAIQALDAESEDL